MYLNRLKLRPSNLTMSTFSSTSKKPTYKRAEIIPGDWRPGNRSYCACVVIGGEMYWGDKWQTSIDEADSDLRCMINNLNYDLIETVEDEGFYPERAIIMEEKYQKSGRTNGLFNGLNEEDGEVSNNYSE